MAPWRVEDFDYVLPSERIAQVPLAHRDEARLLVVGAQVDHHQIKDLPVLLRAGDVLVVNQTRVIPARTYVQRVSGGRIELFCLGMGDDAHRVEAMLRPARRIRVGEVLVVPDTPYRWRVLAALGEGLWRVQGSAPVLEILNAVGQLPLPPYIRRAPGVDDHHRYQTVFASADGAVAAPTAGLHFTPALIERLSAMGVTLAPLTLHVGLGTFKPLSSEAIDAHRLHPERYEIPPQTVAAIASARERGGRVVAVGTTCVRALESATSPDERVPRAGSGETTLFIQPGDRFACVDVLITNFHLPRTSLLMLVCAFAGRERVLGAYDIAIQAGYRFFSYGDACLFFPG